MNTNNYEYDVFLSYRRFNKWNVWIDKHFKPLLHKELQVELRQSNVSIFVDRDNLIEGARWPANLRYALARTKVLIPLICGGYWDSEWCKRELAIMLEREIKCGVNQSTSGLIVPIIIHDGDRIPSAFDKHPFKANQRHVRTHLTSRAGLETFVNTVAVRVAEHHRNCPVFSSEWDTLEGESFFAQLDPKDDSGLFPRLI